MQNTEENLFELISRYFKLKNSSRRNARGCDRTFYEETKQTSF
jgi:hypothetical protein